MLAQIKTRSAGVAGPSTAPTIEPPPTVEPDAPPAPQRTEPERTTTPFVPPNPETAPTEAPDGDPCRTYPFCSLSF